MLALLLAFLWLLPVAVQAETMHQEVENDAFDMRVTLGYDGLMTYGAFFPVRVTIHNWGPDFEGTVGVNAYVDRKQYDRYETDVSLPSGGEKEVTVAVRVYSRQDVFTVELCQSGTVVRAVNVQPDTVVNPGAMMVGVLSTKPWNLANLNITRESDTLARYEYWQTVPLSALSFPETPQLLSSFGMLVLDDIDPASLSEAQQAALWAWLRSGRVVLCGGGTQAARNMAFFSGATGLRLAGVETGDDLIAPLEKSVGRAESGKRFSGVVARIEDGEPLVADAEGRGLVFRTEVGRGRIYTMAFEAGNPSLNAEPLMHTFWQLTLVNRDNGLYNNLLYRSGEDNPGTTFGGYSLQVPVSSPLLAGTLVTLGALLVSCAAWVLLKKWDKRQWLWAVLPGCALAAVLAMWALSASSGLNRPMAVMTTNLIQSGGGIQRYTGIQATAPGFGEHRYAVEGEKVALRQYDYYYDGEEDGETVKEPATLRTTYSAGGENSVLLLQATPWETRALISEGTAKVSGLVDATVWMEEDGFHGEIVNGTDLRLKPGWVLTGYGFVSVPALAPGEKTAFTLVKSEFPAGQDPQVYQNGCAYLGSLTTAYQLMETAVSSGRLTGEASEAGLLSTLPEMATGISNQLQYSRGADAYGYYGVSDATAFIYVAEPENAPALALRADGQKVEHLRELTLLGVEAAYLTVGKTGIVFRSAGMDMPVRVEIDDRLQPGEEMKLSGYQEQYATLSENPTYRFDLSAMKGMEVESLHVLLDEYYRSVVKGYALNVKTGAWDPIPVNGPVTNPSDYVTEEGLLFVQFRPDQADTYQDVTRPMIALEGRMADADR